MLQHILFLLLKQDSYFEYQRQIIENEDKVEKLVHQQYLNEKQLIMAGLSKYPDFVKNTKMIDQTLYQKIKKLLKNMDKYLYI